MKGNYFFFKYEGQRERAEERDKNGGRKRVRGRRIEGKKGGRKEGRREGGADESTGERGKENRKNVWQQEGSRFRFSSHPA